MVSEHRPAGQKEGATWLSGARPQIQRAHWKHSKEPRKAVVEENLGVRLGGLTLVRPWASCLKQLGPRGFAQRRGGTRPGLAAGWQMHWEAARESGDIMELKGGSLEAGASKGELAGACKGELAAL